MPGRCIRNNFIPDLSFNFVNRPKTNESHNDFVNSAFSEKEGPIEVQILRTISSNVSILETRHRDNPSCLDRSANYIPIFVLTGYLWGTTLSLEIEDPTPLELFLMEFIKSKRPLEKVVGTAAPIAKGIEDPTKRLIFLRRVEIFEELVSHKLKQKARGSPGDHLIN